MAPEQLRGEAVDSRCDVYAFGIVLYEMCTGQRPFHATMAAALAADILHKTPPSPRRLRTGLPLDLERIIQRCLEKEPALRYASAYELLADLRGAQARAFRGRWVDRVVRRWPFVASGLVLAVATVVGLNVRGWRDRLLRTTAAPVTLLVLPLEVRGQGVGDDYAGRALADKLAVDLAERQGVRVLPVPEAGEVGGKLLDRVRFARALGAGYVLEGALVRQGSTAEVALSLLDTEERRIVWGTQKSGTGDGLSAISALLAADVAAHLGLKTVLRYDGLLYLRGNPTMAASPLLSEARGAIRRDEGERALAATEKLVQAFPDEPDARVLRTWALAFGARGLARDSPERQAFEEGLAALQRLDPNNPWAGHARAFILKYDGRFREAVDLYDTLLARSDLTPAARAHLLGERADTEFALPDVPAAFTDLEEAIRLDPANEQIFLIYSNVALRSGNIEEALRRGQQAVSLSPGYGLAQLYFGRALFLSGRYEESLRPLELACHDDWNCGDYGRALSLAGRTQEALSVLAKQCEEKRYSFGYIAGCHVYAIALLRAGRVRDAEVALGKARTNPETWAEYAALAKFHAVSGHREEALRALRRSYELRRTEPIYNTSTLAAAYDPDFLSLHGDPQFEAIMAELRQRWQLP